MLRQSNFVFIHLLNILSFIFLLILPGFSFISFLFPNSKVINLEAKLILSITFSIAILELTGLILNFTIGVGIYTLFFSIYFIIFVMSLITSLKFKKRLTESKKIIEMSSFVYLAYLVFFSLPLLTIISIYRVVNDYTYRHLAFFEANKKMDFLNPFIETGGYKFDFVDLYPGYDLILRYLGIFSELPTETIQILPIPGIAITLTLYLLLTKLTTNRLLAIILSISAVPLDMAFSLQFNSVHYYSINALYYLAFLYFLISYLETKNDRKYFIILLSVLYISSLFIHHRAPIWMILTLFGLIGISWIIDRNRHKLVFLALSFLILYLAFNKVAFNQYLPKAVEYGLSFGFDTLNYSIYKIVGLKETTQNYMYPPSPAFIYSDEYNTINSIKHLSFMILTSWAFLFKIKKIFKSGKEMSINDTIFLTLFSCLIAESITYFMIGRVSMLYFTLVSAIFLAVIISDILEKLKKHKLRTFFVSTLIIIILIISAVKFAVAYRDNFNMGKIGYEDILEGSKWSLAHGENIKITGDFRVFSMFLLENSKYYVFPDYIPLSQPIYANIVEGRKINSNTYFLLNKKDLDSTVISMFWWYFEPFSKYYNEINLNPYLDKVYEDSRIEVYLSK